MSKEVTAIFALLTLVTWIFVSTEINKKSKSNEKMGRKLMVLLSAGTILTIFLTISLVKDLL
ncbi:hypothetical protein RCC94_15165 [Exiguobacterium acetylicum]|uniref:hypothetical protein n=1 Tax=Exiguobacterium acetylicum TaxID=41170 RepID=UPI0027DF2264|nr:hypothetical protein [Exiguobacterium acetylicum]MDQ6468837.1 hypothetical protein [Exiguobacterium acetylicum]